MTDVIVLSIILILVFGVIRSMIKDHAKSKASGGGCGCGCSSCSMAGQCAIKNDSEHSNN